MNFLGNFRFCRPTSGQKFFNKCQFCSKTIGNNGHPNAAETTSSSTTTTTTTTAVAAANSTKAIANKTRVIGIMAHIDAGKTTTTERMLYYSGFQKTVGEVHHGDTTMDYLEQERERGITIQSAAITFSWRHHTISLVDTPGHVDFTMEVERCLRVVDGAVAVIDASAGVEAQTTTVWQQADRYSVPRICYLNKMDKPAASHTESLADLRNKLNANPVLIQLPIGTGKQFTGVLDVLTGRRTEWDREIARDSGASFTVSDPITSSDPLYPEYCKARTQLCEQLGDLDNSVAEYILEHEAIGDVPSSLLFQALRRATIEQTCVPTLLGSSYRNTGVQPLLDAVLNYLPGPLTRLPAGVALYSPHFCALAFKIIYDKTRGGLLTFIRVYSGTFQKGDRIYNVTRQTSEKPTKILIALADEFRDTTVVGPGSILVLVGLKKTSTGDTLVANPGSVSRARERLQRKGGAEDQDDPLLLGVKIPDPVFFCSVEAASPRYQKALEDALDIMQREDPSLTVRSDVETGQLVLAGMGELHLEVVASRLMSQYKVDADLGRMQVAYREEITEPGEHTEEIEKYISDSRQRVEITLTVEPAPGKRFKKLELQQTRDNVENLVAIRRPHLNAVTSGVSGALTSGPLLGSPVHGIAVGLKWLVVGRGTSDAFVAAAAGQCIKKLLADCGSRLTEPIMELVVAVEVDYSHSLLGDITKRRGDVKDVFTKGNTKHITAHVPLSELVGYSTNMRRLSSGRATFTMELLCYAAVPDHRYAEVYKSVTGFYPT